jgi:hypothetical protein
VTAAGRGRAGVGGEAHLQRLPGPVPLALVARAEAFWNSAGADAQLTIATSKAAAKVVFTPHRRLRSTEEGVTNMPCQAPCRPDTPETITVAIDHPGEQCVIAHKLGHSLGLAHTHVDTCSVMAPIVAEHCQSTTLPSRIPTQDRDDLVSIWGRAPSPTTARRST